MAAGEVGQHAAGLGEPDLDPSADRGVAKSLRDMGFPDPDSEADRLQHLRSVLPCEVRVLSDRHPLFGRVLAAASFKRWAGELLLVVTLPDGSPGTVRADDTGVFGEAAAAERVAAQGAGVVLDAAGLRELHRLVTAIGATVGSRGDRVGRA